MWFDNYIIYFFNSPSCIMIHALLGCVPVNTMLSNILCRAHKMQLPELLINELLTSNSLHFAASSVNCKLVILRSS